MTLNKDSYSKGDLLYAEMKFTLLDRLAEAKDNTRHYYGWLRCKVE